MKTLIFIVLCANLGYIALGWRHNNRRRVYVHGTDL
nr:MAG TPA: chitin synthase regulator [Caudoviricetes sp.]